VAVSIREVAEKVGVSAGTVSHVLNGNASARIAPATQDRIRQAAEDLGYSPNRLARGLGRGRTDTIGVIISGLRNPFFADIVETVVGITVAAGYHAIVEVTPQPPGDTKRKGNLSGWPVDGILLWAQPWQTLVDHAGKSAQHIPVVYLGYPRTDETDWVAFDLYGGGRVLTEHLFAQGYKRTWYFTPFRENVPVAREARIVAYLDTCARYGQTGRVVLLSRSEETRQIGVETGLQIAAMPPAERPDAIICHNDIVAVGVYHGLIRGGVRVPEEVAVTGFDGIAEGQCLDKPLTTVTTSAEAMCRTAIDLLMKRIAGEPRSPQGVSIPTTLSIGKTT